MNNKRTILTYESLWAVFDGLTAVFLVAYALALGASNLVIGLLGAIPFIAFLLTQLPGVHLAAHYQRKKLFCILGIISDTWWIGILAAPYIASKPIVLVVIFYLFVRLCVGLFAPAYNTLLADIVEQGHRGEFFSKRLKLIGTLGTITVLAAGAWLKIFPKESIIGFTIMFALGTIIGILSRITILRIKEPEYRDYEHHTVKQFLTLEGDFKRYIRFATFFSFAFNLASPFFAVFLLKNMGASYEFYAVVAATSTIAQVFTSRYIGKLSDKYGDKPVTILGVVGTSLVPLGYLLAAATHLWLIIPVSIFSGITWAAADIARFNLMLGLTKPEKEGMQVAEYNFYTAIPLAIAPIIGGYLSEHGKLILTGIPMIFVISTILRASSAIPLLKLKEPRIRKEYSSKYVLRHALHVDVHRGIETTVAAVKRIRDGMKLGLIK